MNEQESAVNASVSHVLSVLMANTSSTLPLRPMRRLILGARIALGLTTLLLLGGIVALCWKTPAHASVGPLRALGTVACIIGGMGVPLTAFILWLYTAMALRAEQMMNGAECLARWTCSVQECERFGEIVRRRGRKNFRRLCVFLGVVAIVISLPAVFAMWQAQATQKSISIFKPVGVVAVVMAVFDAIAYCFMVYIPGRKYRKAANREVYIGADGFIATGQFTCWPALRARLQSVEYEVGEPGSLHFRWLEPDPRTPSIAVIVEAFIPVPKTKDADAKRVAAFFQSRLTQT